MSSINIIIIISSTVIEAFIQVNRNKYNTEKFHVGTGFERTLF